MEPVRVKLYGLMSMTRRGYLAQLIISIGLVVLLLGIWWLKWPEVRERLEAMNSPGVNRLIAICDATPWVLLVMAALLATEAVVVLRLFARKQAAAGKSP